MSKKSESNLSTINFSEMLGGLDKLPSRDDLPTKQPPVKRTKKLFESGEIAAAAEIPHPSYYDFDMAEFPWAIFERSDRPKDGEPIIYEDTITNSDTHEVVKRRFETYPCGQYGHATHSTFELAYLLIQLYIADEDYTDRVRFGSLSNLAKMRGLSVTGPNVNKIRRDLSILSNMSIKSYNAYWDSKTKSYVNKENWRFFGEACYYMPTRNFNPQQEELNFSYIEVSPTFQKIASTRGLFGLGFSQELFFSLSPMEQRLAVYLSRRFKFQSFVKHRVDKICLAIPITAKREDNRRTKLKNIAEGLLEKGFPLLESYSIEKKNRVWTANFKRKRKPTPEKPFWNPKDFNSMTAGEECTVNDMILLTGDAGSKRWFLHCLRELKEPQIFRAMSIFNETYVHGAQPIKNSKGAVLTGILQGIGDEIGVNLRKH